MAELAFDELPLYLVQPTVEPARSAPGPSAAWGVVTPSIGGAGRASTLVMTRIVPLPPSIAVDSLLSWWRGRDGTRVLYGRARFELTTPALRPETCDQCQMRVHLHRPGHLRDTPLEVELSPWSHSLTELDLRPLRWKMTLSDAYYAAGHAFLDLLERSMMGQAERRPVLNRRSWRASW